MDPNTILQIILFLAMEIALPLGFVALMHYKLGKYPKPLPLEKNKRKGILEALIFLVLSFIVVTILMFTSLFEKMADPTPGALLQFILITAIPYILIPVLYLRFVKKWTLKDFGFRKPVPKTRAIMIFAVILFAIAGALPLLNSDFTPLPVLMIIFALWQPAFIEEFFFRGIIQGRLERVIGQNKAWIYGGILFGLVHVTTNYFVVGFDLVPGIFQLIMQILAGWIYGILYMKTRSLYPGMFAHFLTNGVLASIIAMVF
ncbi:CPBP family intramembrane glutamic endopeptidase [Halobacteriota archaeon]